MPEQRIRAAAAIELLPQELITGILLRLPIKCLLRLRSVSKTLRAVVNSADFIDSHLARSSRNFNHRKLIFQDQTTMLINACDVNFDVEEEKEILRLEDPVSCPPSEEIVGYCNGLLLLSRINRFGFALWNPSSRHYRDLPEVPSPFFTRIGSGLGYDDSTDDYKVFVKVCLGFEIEVWIYGLKSNIWRRSHHINSVIDKGCEGPVVLGTGKFADNSLNWLCTISTKREIVSFDFKTETFSLCPQQPPPVNDSINKHLTKIHVLEGSLCITYFSKPVFTDKADSYIRKKEDGGDQFTWRLLYSIAHPCWPNDLLYDLEQKSYKRVKIYKDFDSIGSILSCFCLESLVSVGGGGA